ncbi:MAG TPA: hypothetical protein VEU30_01820 [Thermoanaerobaculia bacterium]|nr:hypothetical protein [Thermoanaerobaculia bacterium]
MRAAAAIRHQLGEHPLDWLAALLLSWLLPLGLAGHVWKLSYRLSLLFWAVPIVLLLPRFISRSRGRPEVRRAFWLTFLYVFIAGCFLDFILGSWILKFDEHGDYLVRFCSLSDPDEFVPLEEVLFYILGAMAIILTYCWADDYWLMKYKVAPEDQQPPPRLVIFSPQALATGAFLLVFGIVLGSAYKGEFHVPLYYVFLDVVAFIPAVALYRAVKQRVNWRAFSFTTLWVLLTSTIWEVTLALPNKWWGYERDAMIGIWVDVWQFGEWAYPIEAMLVWLVVTFTCVLTFEAVKVYRADARPARQRLFGP